MSSIRKIAAGGAVAAAAIAGGGLGASFFGTANAQTTPSTSTSSDSGSTSTDSTIPAHGTPEHEALETPVTGDAATQAQAAAVASVGSGTAGDVTTDAHGDGYEVTVTKDDGTTVEVHLDSSFAVVQGHGGKGGPGGGGPHSCQRHHRDAPDRRPARQRYHRRADRRARCDGRSGRDRRRRRRLRGPHDPRRRQPRDGQARHQLQRDRHGDRPALTSAPRKQAPLATRHSRPVTQRAAPLRVGAQVAVARCWSDRGLQRCGEG